MPPLLADFTHARVCKPFCEKYLTLPKEEAAAAALARNPVANDGEEVDE